MSKSPSKEDRERLKLAVNFLAQTSNFNTVEEMKTLGFEDAGFSPPTREQVRDRCAEMLYDAITSAHDRIDELEGEPAWIAEAREEFFAAKQPPPAFEWENVEAIVQKPLWFHVELKGGGVFRVKWSSADLFKAIQNEIDDGQWVWNFADEWNSDVKRWTRQNGSEVSVKLTPKETAEYKRLMGWMKENGIVPPDGKEYDTLDEMSINLMREMGDDGFCVEKNDIAMRERLHALRRLGYIRHCIDMRRNTSFWILKEKGYQYLRLFDAIP